MGRMLNMLTVAMAACAGTANAAHPLEALKGDAAATEAAFKSHMSKHELIFKGKEYMQRLAIFTDNVGKTLERAAQDPTATHGLTKFSHLSEEEFRAMYLAPPVDPAEYRKGFEAHQVGAKLNLKDVPDSWDWREKGAVTHVKNQGQCGSCWSFSTTGAIEGAMMIQNKTLPVLSEQMLVDCDHECWQNDPNSCDSGCNGGLPANAMAYVQKNGIDTEDSYPYEAVDGECRKSSGKIGATVSNFTLVPADEDQMKQYLYQNGPLSIGIDALWMQSYMGGVSCPYICNPQALDHGVLIVAYGTEGFAPTHLSEMDYWTIKNSWGPAWGEEGYIRMCRGKNKCGLDEMVVSVDKI